MPGDYRDALYESTSISGVPVRLIDTAGIRETTDLVESIESLEVETPLRTPTFRFSSSMRRSLRKEDLGAARRVPERDA